MAVYTALGAVNGWAAARMVGSASVVDFPPLSRTLAARAAIGLGLAAAVAGALMQLWGSDYGYWLPMTVFVLAIPRPGVGLRRAALHRTAGTAVGAVLAGGVALIQPPTGVPLALGSAVLVVAFMLKEPPWLNSALMAAAVVLLLTPPGGDLTVADSRLLATVGGGLIIVAFAAVGAWLSRRHPPSGDETEISQTMARLTGNEEAAGAR